ncbi:acyl-CoA dehydrogenase family protein [Pseudomonas lundensis]|uniref:acyl-CoA dehydrogenase family protein n=1 Tax=Pseudomonas lundensis TaxID=86185 RepID=UPI00193AFA21|nr:acyl-CoA dehydrogenase family protein [Pseudomonas lundensis]MBM1186388.1 flavin-dependent monooxygenase [Pseudomonas lundensis]
MDPTRVKSPIELELLERARTLIPALQSRSVQADKDCKLPDATVRDLQETGLLRALQPKAWGGHEVDIRTFFEIQMTLAEGCMSTAWVFGVMGVHPWQLARYPEQAQRDVWDEDSAALVASTYMPVAKVTPVKGGYQVSGRWGFSSGSQHAQWCFLGGIVPQDETGPTEHGTFLLPASDYRIEQNWDVLGLRGSGSHDIVVEDVFVPAHRVQRTNNYSVEATPGRLINTNPMYSIPFAQVFARAVSTSAIGALQGAINAFRDNAAGHIGKHGAKTAEDPAAQAAVAEAIITVDALKLVLARNYGHLLALAEAGQYPDVETRLLYRYQSSHVTNVCADRASDLLRCMAASGLYSGNPVARYFRDLHQARGHIANNEAAYRRSYGLVQLGLPNADPFV